MYQLLKPILFRFSPEKAHTLTVKALRWTLRTPIVGSVFRQIFQSKNPNLERKAFGLTFPNPVGLAAGFDKDGKYFEDMAALGFGFIEIGTVTPRPQDGNPQPRLFRLPESEALINRMGFNNEGVEALADRLEKFRAKNPNTRLIIGGNIGKNKVTPNEEAHRDYLLCFEELFEYVDYFVVNVSSPNTPDLRALQDKAPLTELLGLLQAQNKQKSSPKPILLKIAPDLNASQLDDIIEIVTVTGIVGIVATNTTIERQPLVESPEVVTAIGAGGLSGKPVQEKSTEIIRYLHQKSEGKIPIIGVGGINSPESAKEKLAAGAVLVQVYSGLVYEGPSLVKRINDAI